MLENPLFSRRKFIKTSLATAAAFTIVPRNVLGGPGFTAPSDQLTKAIIGVGGMGTAHISYPYFKLLAVCDVDEKTLQYVRHRSTRDDWKIYTDDPAAQYCYEAEWDLSTLEPLERRIEAPE